MSQEEVIKKSIEILDRYKTVGSKETWVLKYKDEIIRMPSGKSSWSKKNHATSAFTNSIYTRFSKYRCGWKPGEVTKMLIENKILEVVKIH